MLHFQFSTAICIAQLNRISHRALSTLPTFVRMINGMMVQGYVISVNCIGNHAERVIRVAQTSTNGGVALVQSGSFLSSLLIVIVVVVVVVGIHDDMS